MGLLSGLERFGFKSLDKIDVYEVKQKAREDGDKNKNRKTLAELTEPEMLFEKNYTCPVCDQELKVKTVRQGKAKLLEIEIDMRPKYQNIDPLKYGAILCRRCGYAALTSDFEQISEPRARLVKENITSRYSPTPQPQGECCSYETAMEIHKMALLNAVVKRGKSSEKAYICLKSAWLLRGQAELLGKSASKEKLAQLKKEEAEYLSEAYKGFVMAIQTESAPTIYGMDHVTLFYLCAALAYEIGEYEESLKVISRIYVMKNVNQRIKNRCIDLKELLREKLDCKQACD